MAKRKRALGAGAMEDLRELAETAPGTLLTVALDTIVLVGTVDSAHRTLGAVVQTLRILRERATRGDNIAGAADGKFGGAFATALLDGALSELTGIFALHNRAVYAYSTYVKAGNLARGGGGARPDPSLAAAWKGHLRDALVHAWDARRKLRSAASIARAVEDAVGLFRSSPRGSPDWNTWTSAALRLALHAFVSTTLALRALHRMRGAVALEFYDAWSVLKG